MAGSYVCNLQQGVYIATSIGSDGTISWQSSLWALQARSHSHRKAQPPKRENLRHLGFRGLGFRGLGFRGLGFRGFRGVGFRGLGFRARGSEYPNRKVVGHQIHILNGCWTLKPDYFRTWTLRRTNAKAPETSSY